VERTLPGPPDAPQSLPNPRGPWVLSPASGISPAPKRGQATGSSQKNN